MGSAAFVSGGVGSDWQGHYLVLVAGVCRARGVIRAVEGTDANFSAHEERCIDQFGLATQLRLILVAESYVKMRTRTYPFGTVGLCL